MYFGILATQIYACIYFGHDACDDEQSKFVDIVKIRIIVKQYEFYHNQIFKFSAVKI